MLKRIKRHIKRWNEWRKHNTNGKLHKVLVLIGFIYPPTYYNCLTKEEITEIGKAFSDGFNKGLKGMENSPKNRKTSH